MIEHVVVMAASPSRGMEALTRTRPKAMLPILGKPMIARVMDTYYRADIRNFTIVVGEQEGTVVEWLTSHWHADVHLNFAPQGHRRGTASALFAVRSLIQGPFIITSCDSLVPEQHVVRLSWYFETHPSDAAVLSLFYAPGEAMTTAGVLLDPRGNVAYISEKPFGAHQDFMTILPVYGFTPQILDYLDRVPVEEESGERVLASAIQLMIDDGKLVGTVQATSRVRLDTPQDLLDVNISMLADAVLPDISAMVPANTEVHLPVYLDPGVVINNGVRIGPNVYLESGSIVGSHAALSNCVVLGRQIAAGTKIDGELVSEDR